MSDLGFSTMANLAEALGVSSATLRSWNRRQSIPTEYDARIAALRAHARI